MRLALALALLCLLRGAGSRSCRELESAEHGAAALRCEEDAQAPYLARAPPLPPLVAPPPPRDAPTAHGFARSSALVRGATDAVPWPQAWARCERCALLNASAALLFDPHGAIAPRFARPSGGDGGFSRARGTCDGAHASACPVAVDGGAARGGAAADDDAPNRHAELLLMQSKWHGFFYGGFGDVVRGVVSRRAARAPAGEPEPCAAWVEAPSFVFDVLTWEARARAESARRERAR